MKWQSNNSLRTWLFRVLVALTAVLMLLSFSMPWWTTIGSATSGSFFIKIYGYGLRDNMVQLHKYIAAEETPFYQTVLAWVYVAAIAGLSLLSTWLKGLKGRLLLGAIGLSYIAYAAVAVFIVIAKRIGNFDIALLGVSSSGMYKQVGLSFDSSLGSGYYMAYAAGVLCVVLAVCRNVITGKPVAGTPGQALK